MKWWFVRIDEDGRTLRHYWTTKRTDCAIKARCMPAKMRRITRWEHGDEPPRPGLQHEAGDRDHGRRATDGGGQSLNGAIQLQV